VKTTETIDASPETDCEPLDAMRTRTRQTLDALKASRAKEEGDRKLYGWATDYMKNESHETERPFRDALYTLRGCEHDINAIRYLDRAGEVRALIEAIDAHAEKIAAAILFASGKIEKPSRTRKGRTAA
jgi:hypothetical protein